MSATTIINLFLSFHFKWNSDIVIFSAQMNLWK